MAQGRKKKCPVCKQMIPTTKDGKFVSHTMGKSGRFTCPGSLNKDPKKVTGADIAKMRSGHYESAAGVFSQGEREMLAAAACDAQEGRTIRDPRKKRGGLSR